MLWVARRRERQAKWRGGTNRRAQIIKLIGERVAKLNAYGH